MRREKLLAAAVLALASSWFFFQERSGAGLPWPDSDIVPLVMRILDAEALRGDFFTDATAHVNPRWVQALILAGVSWVTTLDPSETVLLVRSLTGLVTPVVFVLGLFMIREFRESLRVFGAADPAGVQRIVLVLVTLFGVLGITQRANHFAVAWWSPVLGGHATSSAIAIMLASIAMVLSERRRWGMFASSPVFLLAGLVHPVAGPSVAGIYWLFKIAGGVGDWRRSHLALLTGAIIPMGIVLMAFHPSGPVSTETLVEVYANLRHPCHYIPSQFGSLKSPWPVAFSLVSAALAINLLVGALLRDRYHIRLAAGALCLYVGCILAQYLFVELKPIRAVVLLGPSRLSQFGYWLAAFLTARLVPAVWFRVQQERFIEITAGVQLGQKARGLALPCTLGALALVFSGLAFEKGRRQLNDTRSELESEWAWLEPEPNADPPVIAVAPGVDTVGLRETLGVAVAIDTYFPFELGVCRMYGDRYQRLYGSHPDANFEDQPELRRVYFNSLSISELSEIGEAWGVDFWVIPANEHAAFAEIEPFATMGDLLVYRQEDLRPITPNSEDTGIGNETDG